MHLILFKHVLDFMHDSHRHEAGGNDGNESTTLCRPEVAMQARSHVEWQAHTPFESQF